MVRYYPDRIKLARESREYSQAYLAEVCGISQGNISKIEKGLKTPTEEEVEIFAEKLNYPLSFFRKDSSLYPYLKEFYYRRRVATSQKKIDTFEAQVNIITEQIETLLEAIDVNINLPTIDIESENLSPERLAQKMRLYFGIAKGPIKDIVNTIEKAGVIVLYFNFPLSGKIDGVSFITKKGYPVILVNKNSSSSRTVFTLAHELAHLIMHYNFIISDKRNIETEANAFATEFLAPKNEIENDLRFLSSNKLMELKFYWKISIKALLYKASQYQTITKDQYRRWMTYYNSQRWSSGEPCEFDISSPQLLSKIFEIYFTSLQYSKKELLEILNVGEEDLFSFFDLDVLKKYFGIQGRKIKLMV